MYSGLTDSIYLRLRAKNLCNHRDYHNLARSNHQLNKLNFIELNNYYRKLHLNIIGNKVVIEKFFDHTGMVQTLLTPWNTSQPSREVKMTYLRLSSTASSVKMDS